MRQRAPLVVLTLLSPVVLCGSLLGIPGLGLLSALAAVGIPLALIDLASSGRRGRRIRGALLVVWLTMSGSWIGLFWLSARGLEAPSSGQVGLVLGLMLGGLALLPLVVLGWLYAATFSDRGLTPRDLERLRSLREDPAGLDGGDS